MPSKHLHKAKKNKNDEFYTQLSDIEKELKHYNNHFRAKWFIVIVMTQELVISFITFLIILKFWD